MIPNKLLHLQNPDKEFHEEWTKNRNLLNFPHPFRCVLLGPPNCGKTSLIKNVIMRAEPDYEEIYVVHCDSNYTKEYDDLGDSCILLDEIPQPSDWRGEVKTLVVLDDLEYKFMDKLQKQSLDRLFGYVSTHKNISCCLAAQDCFNVPPIVRRCSNVWFLWQMADINAMSAVASRTGMESHRFKKIFSKFKSYHDSLCIDMTNKSPMGLRKNGFEAIG